MSKLDELIKELCPDGVEYKTLGDVCEVFTGGEAPDDSIKEKNPRDEYIFPIYSNGIGENALWGYAKSYRIDQKAVTFSSIGTIGYPTIREAKFIPIIRLKVIVPKDNNILTVSFLKYALEIVEFEQQKSSVPNINANMIKALKIPVPPLPVQEEIVRILDTFTSLTAELEAELEARRKQYEYYRDSLLTFGDDVEWKTLGEIATAIYRGSGIKRDQVTSEGIPCVRYGEIYTSYNIHFNECISHTILDNVPSPKYFEHGDILFAITGESVEDIAKSIAYMGNEKCLAGGDIVVLKHNQNPKYLSFALSTNNAIMQKGKGKVKSKVVHSSVPSISELKIPVPDLETQEKIANILDNFLQLTTNITAGLPAEIEARQKQYEYYRDKLLTFEEKEV